MKLNNIYLKGGDAFHRNVSKEGAMPKKFCSKTLSKRELAK